MNRIGTITAGMSVRARRRLAWCVAPLVAVAVIGGVTLSSAASSPGKPALPSRSAAQLIADVQRISANAYSGTITETANLGLPSLPGAPSDASLSWQSFLTGTHTAKIWVDGMAKQRLALTGQLSEADVIHNGADLWTYTSDTNTVTHAKLSGSSRRHPPASANRYTPSQSAAALLKAVGPSTSVTVGSPSTVAGRPSYTLVVAPKDSRSTVREIRVAIDAATHLPLRLQVYGASTTPVLQVGFTSISFHTPASSVFAFSKPAGAKVSNDPLGLTQSGRPNSRHSDQHSGPPMNSRTPGNAAEPTTLGTGWMTVVELRGGIGAFGGTVQHATTAVGTSGARLLHTSVINAVLLPDGRAFVGAVSPAYLEHVAATTH